MALRILRQKQGSFIYTAILQTFEDFTPTHTILQELVRSARFIAP
jgi:hypothetical protein